MVICGGWVRSLRPVRCCPLDFHRTALYLSVLRRVGKEHEILPDPGIRDLCRPRRSDPGALVAFGVPFPALRRTFRFRSRGAVRAHGLLPSSPALRDAPGRGRRDFLRDRVRSRLRADVRPMRRGFLDFLPTARRVLPRRQRGHSRAVGDSHGRTRGLRHGLPRRRRHVRASSSRLLLRSSAPAVRFVRIDPVRENGEEPGGRDRSGKDEKQAPLSFGRSRVGIRGTDRSVRKTEKAPARGARRDRGTSVLRALLRLSEKERMPGGESVPRLLRSNGSDARHDGFPRAGGLRLRRAHPVLPRLLLRGHGSDPRRGQPRGGGSDRAA